MFRLLFAAVFLLGLPFGLCSKSVNTTDQLKVEQAAIAAFGDDPSQPPTPNVAYDCMLSLTAVPRTPSLSTPVTIQGSCEWTVEQQGNIWLATYRQTWLCSDWSAHVANYPDCTPPTGQHAWQFQVDLQSSNVEPLGDSGPYPPDPH